MAINHIQFNLTQGIEGLAQSPAQGNSLGVLPQSQQVLPSGSIFTGAQAETQSAPWMQGASRWDKALQDFIMPHISSHVLMPAELKARLEAIRRDVDKRARKEKSKEKASVLRNLADALQDDADLQDALHAYRSALVRI